ncbi:hypothetical protein BC936DRAFT_141666 [Jimgerdemannia flammicorona]|uniref:SANT domain-containing protein n=1 Tax=Jimgerdemannia flammicorona TaxID=994334 RepID=A0A433A1U6_9FUNG|nr:hypothetical protein BC936DRAFT_141666 [Jimgerdemannia flammicorona]
MTILDESPLLSPVPDSISPSPEPIPLDDRKLRNANLATVDPDPEAADLLVKVKAKQEWVKGLRLKFCVRPEFEITKNMIHEDGTLNQDYFRPPKGAKPEEARKWTDREKELLLQGIEKHGIGHFREISDEFLPAWVSVPVANIH